jgi:hypothetical protein
LLRQYTPSAWTGRCSDGLRCSCSKVCMAAGHAWHTCQQLVRRLFECCTVHCGTCTAWSHLPLVPAQMRQA